MSSSDQPAPRGCFFPLHSLSVHPQGHMHFCLTSKLPAFHSHDVMEEQRKVIHRELLEGKWPASCRACRMREESGLASRRTSTWRRRLKRYGNEAVRMVNEGDRTLLRHVDLSFSNLCNLSCVMCSSEYSTRWAGPDARARAQGLEFRAFTRAFDQPKRAPAAVIDSIFHQADELDLIVIKGGEPTRDPHCLAFLRRLAARPHPKKQPWVVIQSNGTRAPAEWTIGLENLEMEVGCSIDGWGEVYEWVRGASFEKTLANLRAMAATPSIKALSVDFTLSAFNCHDLPRFLEKVLELKKEVPKIQLCEVQLWVQQPYASPLVLPTEERAGILEKIGPLLDANNDFFLGAENMRKVLSMPQLSGPERGQAARWMEYMNGLRSRNFSDVSPAAAAALSAGSLAEPQSQLGLV